MKKQTLCLVLAFKNASASEPLPAYQSLLRVKISPVLCAVEASPDCSQRPEDLEFESSLGPKSPPSPKIRKMKPNNSTCVGTVTSALGLPTINYGSSQHTAASVCPLYGHRCGVGRGRCVYFAYFCVYVHLRTLAKALGSCGLGLCIPTL